MKVGILGAGNIAGKMARTLNGMTDAEAWGVASRELPRAQAFAEKFGIPRAYGSYEDLLKDPEVELVYVATPHSHHYAQMKLCLDYGKHLLCEKSFTVNAGQAEEICRLGREKKLLVAEAIWTRYLPMRKVMDDVLASGIIGTPRVLHASLCQAVEHKRDRIANPQLAGGALLDMGVYAVNFAFMCFGSDIREIKSAMVPGSTGVDAISGAILIYKDGKAAFIYSAFNARSDRHGVVSGDKGYVVFKNINNCDGIEVYDLEDRPVATYYTPPQITGFEYQVEACKRAIEKGLSETPEMPHREILKVLETMDAFRKEWGLKYPFE
jgi:predicted dehydrogenase